jgi:membrane-associated phospholipid phosphatase
MTPPALSFTQRFLGYLKKTPRLIFLLAGLFVGALLVFAGIVHEVLGENEQGFDSRVFAFFQQHIVGSSLTPLMETVTSFASAPFQFILYPLLIAWYLVRKKKFVALDIFIIGLSGFLLTFLLKDLFHRARPSNPLIDPVRSFSFPSGHASSGFILYGLLAFLIFQEKQLPYWVRIVLSTLLISFSLVIGLSRIYLHVHYASDVVAGFCLGFAWLSLSLYILHRSRQRSAGQHQ